MLVFVSQGAWTHSQRAVPWALPASGEVGEALPASVAPHLWSALLGWTGRRAQAPADGVEEDERQSSAPCAAPPSVLPSG